MNEGKFILVTGGAGYIGSHTVVELIKSGYTPIIADDFRNANKVVLDGLRQIVGCELIIHEIDVCDRLQLETLFQTYSFHGIIHFAAYKAVGESVLFPLKYYNNNILALTTTIELALKYSVHDFVFSSSCTVYGEPKDQKVVKEHMLANEAFSPYGNTKLIGEKILRDVQKVNPELKVVNLRYFNPVGAHPSGLIGEYPLGKPNNLLPFITQTASGKQKELIVFGKDYPTPDGTCIRDYIHVCDLADAHVKALQFMESTKGGYCEAFNIGTGKGTSILELIRMFEDCSSLTLNFSFGPRRDGDIPEIYADAEKANSVLKWSPEYAVKDAVAHAWNWEQTLMSYA